MAKQTGTETATSVVKLVINGEGAKTSLKELGSALNVVNNKLREMKEADNPVAYKEALKVKQAMTAEYLKQKTALGDVRSSWSKYMSEVKTIATGVLGGNIITWLSTTLMNVIPAALDKIIKKRDQLADIQRTTNLTDQEVKALDKDLKALYTRTETGELRGIASIAGQFNVAKKEIPGFVENVDKANVALKELGGAEAAASTLAKLDNVFKDIEGRNIGDRVLHIANALNVLEASGVATSPVIADMSSRMGRALVPLQVGTDKVLGMAAAMEEMNLSAELGSTAVIEAFQRMLTETSTFAKVAGMDLKEYKQLINDDIYAAFLKYLEGLQRVKGDQLQFAAALEASKLSGSGAMQTMGAMVDNYDLLKDKINIAGKALKNTDSIQEEFSKKNYALAVNLKKLSEWFGGLYTSSGLQAFVEGVVNGTAKLLGLVDASQEATSAFQKQRSVMDSLNKNISPLLFQYDLLKSKSTLTKEEQAKLKTTIDQIAAAVPEAVTQFDAYGRAMDINTGKARVAIGVQAELLKYYNKAAIKETENELDEVRKRRLENKTIRESGKKRELLTGPGGALMTERPLTREEMLKLDAEMAAQTEEEKKLKLRMQGLTGEEPSMTLAERRRLRNGGGTSTDRPAPPTGAPLDLDKPDKDKKDKKSKPITPGIPYDTWQEAIDGEIEAFNDLYEAIEKEKKELADKAAAADKELMEASLFELEMHYEDQRMALEMSYAQELITEEEYQNQKSELEKTYALSQLVLKQSHGEQILDEQRKLNDLLIEDEQRKTDALVEIRKAEGEYDKEQAEKRKEHARLHQQATYEIIDGVGETIATLKSATKEGSKMYKAMVIAEKAWGIASTIINAQQEIANYWKLYSGIPGGQIIAGVLTGVAVARSVASIAKIASTDVPDAKFEEGGFTESDRKTAAGYVRRPTRFNLGGIPTRMGEKYKPEFVISNAALQSEPVAQFANMIDAVQKSGNWSVLNNLGSGGSQAPVVVDNSNVVSAIAALRRDMQEMSRRPINFNIDRFEDFQEFLLKIEKDTSA